MLTQLPPLLSHSYRTIVPMLENVSRTLKKASFGKPKTVTQTEDETMSSSH